MQRFFTIISFSFLICSCMSYERVMDDVNSMVTNNSFQEASAWIEKKKVFKKSRNEILLNLELASIERMKGNVKESNDFLNRADILLEDRKVNVGQRAMSLISNPLSLPYNMEFYENIAMHYYKSLNYIQLNDQTGARVEARRANLALQRLNDAAPDKPLNYGNDVLANVMMGLTYELNKEYNNAFTAYRNAVDLFIKDGKVVNYLGQSMPKQLACDLLKVSKQLGFGEQYRYYSKILKSDCSASSNSGSELIVFWENGRSPQKREMIIDFSLGREGGGLNIYNDNEDIYSSLSANELRNYNYNIAADHVTVALPVYRERYYPLKSADIKVNGKKVDLELVENLNTIAKQSLKDRYFRELGNAILRVLTKRAIQEGLSQIDIYGKEDDKKKNEEEENEEKEEVNGRTPIDSPTEEEDESDNDPEVDLGQLFNVVSSLTERADIRSWQSLPAEIHYSRIPLKSGLNTIDISFYNRHNKLVETETIKIKSSDRLQVRSLITPYKNVVNPVAGKIVKNTMP